jgi:hypothetical protein
MSAVEYLLVFFISLPVIIAIDLDRLMLAFSFFLLLQLPVIIVYLIPDISFIIDFKWLIFSAQLYYLKYKLKNF